MAPVPRPTIQHFTHPSHPLLQKYDDKQYRCDGCKIIGAGKSYRCDSCDFDLHEHCATCPRTFSSYMHPKHQLSLVMRMPKATRQNDRACDVCGDHVEGLFYRCELCEFDVHPLCSQLPQQVRHPLHLAHPLTLEPSSSSCCLVCKSVCTSWRYRCGICCVDIHLECILSPCNETSARSVPQQFQPQPSPHPPPYGGYHGYGVPSSSSPYNMYQHPYLYPYPYPNPNHGQGSGATNVGKASKMGKVMFTLAVKLTLGVVGIPDLSSFI